MAHPTRGPVPEQTRVCAHCGAKFQSRNPRKKYHERSCERKAYNLRNVEKIRARQRERRAGDPEKYREYQRTYQLRNADKVRARQRGYYAADPETFRNYQRAWRAKDPERARAMVRAYRAENREKFREAGRRDYARHSEKRKVQSRANYARVRTELEAAQRILALPKGGHPAEDERAASADYFYNQGMRWAAIKDQVEAKFHVHTTVKALQELRRRWLKRQEPTN